MRYHTPYKDSTNERQELFASLYFSIKTAFFVKKATPHAPSKL